MSSTDLSAKLFADACTVIPGGVNSPVRAFSAVGGTPRFITAGNGCWLTDADDNRYVDLVCSWGPMILGHAHPAVVDAVTAAAARGLSFGAPTPCESELAAEIIGRVAPVELLRLVNSDEPDEVRRLAMFAITRMLGCSVMPSPTAVRRSAIPASCRSRGVCIPPHATTTRRACTSNRRPGLPSAPSSRPATPVA